MHIESVSSQAVALCLTRQELAEHNPEAQTLPVAARTLVREVLLGEGQPPWREMDLELFARGVELLILARPLPESPAELFRFADFEDLVQAALAAPSGLPCTLYILEGDYLLLYRGEAPGLLYEYAQGEACGLGYGAHLREHGQLLAAGCALDTLREYFGGKR